MGHAVLVIAPYFAGHGGQDPNVLRLTVVGVRDEALQGMVADRVNGCSILAQAAALSELYAQLSAARAGTRPARRLSAVTCYKALLGRGHRTRRLA
jgi:hypothetical protein